MEEEEQDKSVVHQYFKYSPAVGSERAECSQRVNREPAQRGTAPLPHWGSLWHWNGTRVHTERLNQVTNSAGETVAAKRLEVRLKSYHERLLLLHCLEAAVTELGGGVDELEVDLLQGTTAGLHQERLENKTGNVSVLKRFILKYK